MTNRDLEIFRNHDDTILEAVPSHIARGTPVRITLQLLNKEFQAFVHRPLDKISFARSDDNVCTWYFLVNGYEETPYEAGLFMGVIFFPPNFPFSAPEIQMISPTGRFYTRTAICLSMTAYHEESWNPAWSIEKIMMGFISYMNSTEHGTGCFMPKRYDDDFRQEVAKCSKTWLVDKCSAFKEMFPLEYALLVIAKNDKEDVSRSVLHHSIQNDDRYRIVKRRLANYFENHEAIQIQLGELTSYKHEDILRTYFSSVSTQADVSTLGVESFEETATISTEYNQFEEDDEDEDNEIEFYSSDDE